MSREDLNSFLNDLVYNFNHFNALFISHLSLPLDHMRNIGRKILNRVFPFHYNFNEIEMRFNYNYSTCQEVLRRILQDREFLIDLPTPRIGKKIKVSKDSSLSSEVKTLILMQRKDRSRKDRDIEAFYNTENFKVRRLKKRKVVYSKVYLYILSSSRS
jgi:hypothetical protein